MTRYDVSLGLFPQTDENSEIRKVFPVLIWDPYPRTRKGEGWTIPKESDVVRDDCRVPSGDSFRSGQSRQNCRHSYSGSAGGYRTFFLSHPHSGRSILKRCFGAESPGISRNYFTPSQATNFGLP